MLCLWDGDMSFLQPFISSNLKDGGSSGRDMSFLQPSSRRLVSIERFLIFAGKLSTLVPLKYNFSKDTK